MIYLASGETIPRLVTAYPHPWASNTSASMTMSSTHMCKKLTYDLIESFGLLEIHHMSGVK